MSFGEPQWLWGVLALPVLVLLFVQAERRGARRLRDFVAPRLLPQLTAAVNHFRRRIRFGLQLLGIGLALVSVAQPRWGYTFEDVKRKGIDLLIAVDTSRSMLSNDVQPNRLERVKLATQDLISQLQGDRAGLIAFAGRAFVQAPLTIDYDAVVEAINDLDTKTIPEGGTNISEAITLAGRTYGKSAVGNRALVIFTDGEELSGDAIKTAKAAAADQGIKIFTVGVGTPEGSLIPIGAEGGDAAFVKDSKGQVVKSKLDEKRLREIAESTGGFYLHLENGPRAMRQLFTEGLAKMSAGDIDARLSRRPIERYEWPLGMALIALAASIFVGDRKRLRERRATPSRMPVATAAAVALIFILAPSVFAAAPGLDDYRNGNFSGAYNEFQQTLKDHPQSSAEEKLQFDSGAAAYKMKDYAKALESYSQALLSPDLGLQSKSHYNLGNTLYQRGETQPNDDKKLGDWTNALQHYEETLKMEPQNQEAKDNYDYVKKKIDELKKKKQEQKPPPQQKPQKNDKKDKQDKSNKDQQQQQGQQDKQQQDKQQQSQAQNQQGQDKKPDNKQDQAQAKNEPQKNQQPKPDENPSPSEEKNQPSPSPSPGNGKNENQQRDSSATNPPQSSPSPSAGENASPSPSPGEGEGSDEGASPSPTGSEPPKKKFAGEIKGASDEKPPQPESADEVAIAEAEKNGQMSERQAEALLRSMKDEEARVQLDERRVMRHVYNDW